MKCNLDSLLWFTTKLTTEGSLLSCLLKNVTMINCSTLRNSLNVFLRIIGSTRFFRLLGHSWAPEFWLGAGVLFLVAAPEFSDCWGAAGAQPFQLVSWGTGPGLARPLLRTSYVLTTFPLAAFLDADQLTVSDLSIYGHASYTSWAKCSIIFYFTYVTFLCIFGVFNNYSSPTT